MAKEVKEIKEKNVITIDPSLQYERLLHYKEKHSGWEVFKYLYWGIYLFVVGLLILVGISDTLLYGLAITIFSVFVIIYGFTVSLHLKLMKKYG